MVALFRYFLKRLVWTIPTLLLVAFMVFFMVRLIPGDPVQLILGDQATPLEVARLEARYGLDRSIPEQFVYWLGRIVQGDLGQSITNGRSVLSLIVERFQVSALICVLSVALAVIIAIPLGLLGAWKQNGSLDLGVVTVSTLSMSVPSFWLGMVLLLVFGLYLGWLPVVGFVPIGVDFGRSMTFIVLPVITLALVEFGGLARMVRASAVEVMRLEYVTHARAKGLSERRVMLRHVFPNAFAPTLTMIGLVVGNLLGGIAVLETVFTLPGLGRLLVDSIFARDYPVIQGCLLFTALVYVVVNLVVDLLYPFFDPRVAAS
jgi:peptide/nickel transport system permease protein